MRSRIVLRGISLLLSICLSAQPVLAQGTSGRPQWVSAWISWHEGNMAWWKEVGLVKIAEFWDENKEEIAIAVAVIVVAVVFLTIASVKQDADAAGPVAERARESVVEKITKLDIRPYGDFAKFPGDKLEGHEVVQSGWLKAHGLSKEIKMGNPAVALPPNWHDAVTKIQRDLQLHDPSVVRGQTALENLNSNIEALQKANVPEGKIQEIYTKVGEFINKNNLQKE